MSLSYQVGGSVAADNALYIERQADKALYQHLKDGELCYVFNSRQMGKSSLLLSAKQRLQNEGVQCCFIDMSRIGSVNITQQQWYAGIVSELWRGFGLASGRAMIEWWQSHGDLAPSQKLTLFLEEELVGQHPQQKFTLFFDEIDSVLSLPFAADDFFSLLRAFYNKRADDKRFNQLTFAFFGVALPSDLIRDGKRSPFNIGKAISLEGFTYQEATPLTQGLNFPSATNAIILKRILHWSNGQPFLTQKICQLFSRLASEQIITEKADWIAWVDEQINLLVINNWESNDNPEHLKTIRDRLLFDEQYSVKLLSSYLQILEAGSQGIELDKITDLNRLYLTGLVAKVNNNAYGRTLIYQTVFDSNWLHAQLNNRRPYGQKLNLWLQSNRSDDQWLLPAQSLAETQNWAKDKHLPEDDYQFFAASQEKINLEMNAWNTKLQSEIEQRKIAESALQQALINVELAKDEALAANLAKSEFLARVSHEVRTHLNSILGISYIAQQQEYNKSGHTPLNRIHRVANYMHGIVNDMLDIDRLEKDQLSLTQETFYLDDVIDKLVGIVLPQIKEKGLVFNVEFPEEVLPAFIGDPLRVEQLLSNLLTNAIKYTEQGQVTLSIKSFPVISSSRLSSNSDLVSNSDSDFGSGSGSDNIAIRFDISDTGDGIAKHVIEGEINTPQTKEIQLGIGLKLCHKLAKLMQGTLKVNSIPLKGTTFTFTHRFPASLTSQHKKSDTKQLLLITEPENKPLQQQLLLLGHGVSTCTIDELNAVALKDIDILITDDHALQQQNIILKNTITFKRLKIIPYISQDEDFPHWLSVLGYKERLNCPSSTRHIDEIITRLDQVKNKDDYTELVSTIHTEQQQTNVLVVDDDEINQEIVTELLQSIGVFVDTASNGIEALNAIKVNQYNLVLMDIEMPIMGGEQAFIEIKKLTQQACFKHLSDMPVIALTAHALIDDRKKYLLSGMSDYIAKPIEPNVLINVIKHWLSKTKVIQTSIYAEHAQPKESVKQAPVTLTIPEIDTHAGLQRCNNNAELYQKILRQFAVQYQHGIDKNTESDSQIKQLSHTIKGAAANLGANQLSEQAKFIEQQITSAKEIDESTLIAFNTLIKVTCENILTGVTPSNLKTTSHSAISNKTLTEWLNSLVHAVDEDHAEAISLIERLLSTSDTESIAIEEAMNSFDTEQVKYLSLAWLKTLQK